MSWREAHRARVMELERAAAAVMLRVLQPILDGVATRFAAVVAAAEDEASIDDLAGIQVQWQAAVHNEVLPWFGGIYTAGAAAAEEQVLGLGLVVPDADPELLDHAAAAYLQQAEPRFFALGEDAWTAARAELVAGFQAGEGIPELRRRIMGVTDLTRAQADALARTEVISASNMGADARVDLMGADAPGWKQWLATDDQRTRPTHRHADGQVVPRSERFEVGAARLKVPGDPAGPGAEVVNCRCTVLYLETPTPIPVDTPGRGQGGIVDEVARDRATVAAAGVAGPDQVDSTTGEPHTGAMVALVPADPEALALADGEPPDALHLTLAYLGDGDAIPDDVFAELTDWLEALADIIPVAEANVFGAAVWNTSGDEPCLVLSVGGGQLEPVHLAVWDAIFEAGYDSGWEPPEQHAPWVAHVAMRYGPADTLNPTMVAAQLEGPITFDRLRLTRGSQAIDFPLADQPEEDDDMNPIEARAAGRAIGQAAAAALRERHGGRRGPRATTVEVEPLTLRLPANVDPATVRYLTRDANGVFSVEHTYGVTAVAAPSGGPEPMPGEHLRAVMTVLGESTGGDGTGRTFTNTEYREPPFAFNYQVRSSAHGGLPEVVHVGNVVRVVKDGPRLWAFIQLDLESEQGAEYARRSVAGFERWVSIGLDEKKPTITLVWPDPGDEPDPDDPNPPTELYEPVATLIDGGRVGELTGVSLPALADATVEPTAELLALFGQAAEAEPLPAEEPEPVEPVAASAHFGDGCGCEGACGSCGPTGMSRAAAEATPADQVQSMTAAAMTITLRELPPAEWFREPTDVEMPGALMINDSGRVWGMLAPLGTGHRAFHQQGQRLEAPYGNVDYSRFQGAWAATDAGLVPAGPMTMDCGHAPTMRTNHDVALEHYDNSCSVFAQVAAGEMTNRRGVWVAGAITPGVRPDQVARALACRCSGDWQPHPDQPGMQELVACLLVPTPGFGSSHPETVYEGEALVASSVPVRFHVEHPAAVPGDVARARARAAGIVALADAAGRAPAERVRRLLGG